MKRVEEEMVDEGINPSSTISRRRQGRRINSNSRSKQLLEQENMKDIEDTKEEVEKVLMVIENLVEEEL